MVGWVRLRRQTTMGRVGIFGDDLLQLLLLAVGAAMVVGNLGAILRPREGDGDEGDLDRAPVGRSLVMAGIGAVASVWALVSLS